MILQRDPGSLALLYPMLGTHMKRLLVVARFAAIVAVSAGYGATQVWRMPRETRPLFRTRKVTCALGLVYGCIILGLIAAAVAPAAVLTGAVGVATACILASRFAAHAILRSRPRSVTSGNRRP